MKFINWVKEADADRRAKKRVESKLLSIKWVIPSITSEFLLMELLKEATLLTTAQIVHRTKQKKKRGEQRGKTWFFTKEKFMRDGSIDNTLERDIEEPPKQRIVHYTTTCTYFIYCPHTNFIQHRNGLWRGRTSLSTRWYCNWTQRLVRLCPADSTSEKLRGFRF